MADRLKDLFNEAMVRGVAADLSAVWPRFDAEAFVRDAVAPFASLELVARAAHVADVLRERLPARYADAIRIIVRALGPALDGAEPSGFAPFRYLPYVNFVARFGLDDLEHSLSAQHEITRRFTAEWSIRPFLERHPEATLARLHVWATDPSLHVRRLVSEGTRTRLPWAPRLRAFQRDPTPVLALLELLKDDPERYVQRSVANSLNDIAKDDPERVVETARRWLADATPARRWIVRHALRSLVKAGHPGALDLMGAGAKPRLQVESVTLTPKRVKIGGKLAFEVTVRSTARRSQSFVVDYAVLFVKANGSRRPKVFKLRTFELAGGAGATLSGRVSFAPMTTRTVYVGTHALELRVNGVAIPLGEFEVRGPTRS